MGNCEEELPKKPVSRLSAVCQMPVARLLADCQLSFGHLLANSWPTGFATNTDYQSADGWPTDNRQLVMCR